jgi:hypothetical protein
MMEKASSLTLQAVSVAKKAPSVVLKLAAVEKKPLLVAPQGLTAA